MSVGKKKERKSEDTHQVKSLSLETQLAALGGQGGCPAGRVGLGMDLH